MKDVVAVSTVVEEIANHRFADEIKGRSFADSLHPLVILEYLPGVDYVHTTFLGGGIHALSTRC
jgi:hypothetical protein